MTSISDILNKLGEDIGALEEDNGDLDQKIDALSDEISSLEERLKSVSSTKLLLELVHKQQELRTLVIANAKSQILRLETAKIQIQLSVREGKYFAATKRVWKSVLCDLDPGLSAKNWCKLIRQTVDFDCIAMTKLRKRAKLYEKTKDHAKDKNLESITVTSSRSSTATLDTKQKIWSRDVAGNAIDEYAEGAHLLPAGKSDHVDWFRIGGAAVGLDKSNSDVMTQLKATRGCKNPKYTDKRRFEYEGVLHFVSNRLYLTQQKYLIDGNTPKMLIVPILPLDEIRRWAGTGYDAVVLVGEPSSETPVEHPMTEEEVSSAFSAARLNNDKMKIAEPQQVIDAADVLKGGVVALAEMLLSVSDEELSDVKAIDSKSAERLRAARQNLKNSMVVDVPEVIDNYNQNDDCNVMLVSFSAHSEDESSHHVAPDPLLLLFKAANIYGRLTGMDYLANGVIPTFDSASDIEQMEVYAALLGKRARRVDSPTGMLVEASLFDCFGQVDGLQRD